MCLRKESVMLLTFLLYVSFAAAAKEMAAKNVTKQACAVCVKIYDRCYNITHLLDFQADFRDDVVITKLGILHSQNRLYYAYEPKISDPEYYKVGYVNLNSPETQGVVKGDTPVVNYRTFAIDQKDKVIYIGAGNGIHKAYFDEFGVHFSSIGDTIKDIFFKKKVYFVRDDDNNFLVTKEDDDTFGTYPNFKRVKNFVIDKNDYVVFLNSSGLYVSRLSNSDIESVRLSTRVFYRGLTTDTHGDVYAWWIDGIYKVVLDSNLKDSKIVKVADIDRIGAVTFDNNNNILFSYEKGLFRLDLVQSKEVTC